MRIGDLNLNTTVRQIIDKLILDCRHGGFNYFSKGYKSVNGYLVVQCPYHKFGREKHPSAQFRESDGLFYCFGCKETHSLADVVSHCLQVNGRSWLLENFDGSTIEERNVKFNINSREQQKVKYVDKEILKAYRFTHPYMFERKLNLDTIRKFDIGYDKEHDCITFPNRDEFGNILFIATRNVKNKYFHYPEGVDKPVYGLYEIYRERRKGVEINEVYVCESMLDSLAIWSYGKYAIALNGTGSSHQYELIKKSDLRYLILATDNDDAGKKAREKFRKNVTNKIIKEIDYKGYGDCKDINDMTKEQFLSLKIK